MKHELYKVFIFPLIKKNPNLPLSFLYFKLKFLIKFDFWLLLRLEFREFANPLVPILVLAHRRVDYPGSNSPDPLFCCICATLWHQAARRKLHVSAAVAGTNTKFTPEMGGK